ncbi:unnamed protein product, partial [Amoebophrya sp. A25]|eukprot:GSA25T00021407001.1
MATIAAEGENAGTPSWAPRLRASSPWSPDESLQDEGARLLSQRKKEAPAVLQWSRFWRSDRWRFAARIVLYVCVCVLVFVLFHLLFGTPWTNTTPQRFGHSLDTSRHGGAPAQAGKDPADRPRIFSLDSNGQAWANGTAFFQGVKTDYMGINIRIDAVLHAISPCLTDDIRTQTLMDMQRDLVKGGAEDVTVSGKTTPLEWTGESQRGSRITTVKAVLVYLTVLQCRFGYAKWLTTAGQEVGLADAIREEREPMKKMFEFVVRIALGGGLNEESKGLTLMNPSNTPSEQLPSILLALPFFLNFGPFARSSRTRSIFSPLDSKPLLLDSESLSYSIGRPPTLFAVVSAF